MTQRQTIAVRTTLIVCFSSFVLLGLPEGILGTAWPDIRATFDQPVGRLGWFSASYAAGYLLSSLVSGRLVRRLGLRRSAAAMAVVASSGVALIGAAPLFAGALAGSALLGAGVGGIDSSLNAYMTLRHGPREMQAMHGFFGVGAALGPLFARGTLSLDLSWRLMYLLLGGLWLIVSFRFSTDEELDVAIAVSVDPSSDPQRRHAQLASVLLLVYFALYVSAEVIVGQWSFSLLTEKRGVGENLAGFATAGFWGGLTVGRFGLSALGNRAEPFFTLRASIVTVLLAIVVFWVDPSPGFDLVAMAVLGLGMAGIFPSLVTATPELVGRRRTANLVGYQLAAASAGFIVCPLLLGSLVESSGLEAMPPFVFAIAVCLTAVHIGLERVPRI